jgi:hypothetical protein
LWRRSVEGSAHRRVDRVIPDDVRQLPPFDFRQSSPPRNTEILACIVDIYGEIYRWTSASTRLETAVCGNRQQARIHGR